MFMRTAQECWTDITFVLLLVTSTEAVKFLINAFPMEQGAFIALFLGALYIIGLKDGRFEQWEK